MKLRVSDKQSKNDLDSNRKSCDVCYWAKQGGATENSQSLMVFFFWAGPCGAGCPIPFLTLRTRFNCHMLCISSLCYFSKAWTKMVEFFSEIVELLSKEVEVGRLSLAAQQVLSAACSVPDVTIGWPSVPSRVIIATPRVRSTQASETRNQGGRNLNLEEGRC